MSIHRQVPSMVSINSSFLHDKSLSLGAKGLLATLSAMIYKHPGVEILDVFELMQEDTHVVETLIEELLHVGYLVTKQDGDMEIITKGVIRDDSSL